MSKCGNAIQLEGLCLRCGCDMTIGYKESCDPNSNEHIKCEKQYELDNKS